MPNLPSAWKRMRQSEQRRLRNRSVRSTTKTWIKKVELAVRSKDPKMDQVLRSCIKMIDQAASKGVLHKNAAARRKSRVARLVASAKGK